MINLNHIENLEEVEIVVASVTQKVKERFGLETIELKVAVGSKVYYEGETSTGLFLVLEVDVNNGDTFGLSVDSPCWVHIGTTELA